MRAQGISVSIYIKCKVSLYIMRPAPFVSINLQQNASYTFIDG